MGEPVALADSVQYNRGTARASFSVSRTGTLVYQAHKDLAALVWFDRAGAELGPVGPQGDYLSMRISPEGRRAIFARWDPQAGNYVDWKLDLDRQRGDAPDVRAPVGARRCLDAERDRDLLFRPGWRSTARLSTETWRPAPKSRCCPPRDSYQGPRMCRQTDGWRTFQLRPDGTDIWTVPVDGTGAPSLLVNRGYDARFSPDGRFVSFISGEGRCHRCICCGGVAFRQPNARVEGWCRHAAMECRRPRAHLSIGRRLHRLRGGPCGWVAGDRARAARAPLRHQREMVLERLRPVS